MGSCVRQTELGLQTLRDLYGVLPRVEKALRDLSKNRAGKTVSNYAEAIGAMCDWAVKRGYLADDPLQAMAPFDTTPLTQRRAMTTEEFARLLKVSEPHQALLFETAYMSGLRANELRSLTVNDLSLEPCGFHLDAAWTKNRKAGFQPLDADLAHRLHDTSLYRDRLRRCTTATGSVKPQIIHCSTYRTTRRGS